MEAGLLESYLYSHSLFNKFEFLEILERECADIFSEETKKFISDFKKEFKSPCILIDLERKITFDELKSIYLIYKDSFKGIWKIIWNLIFLKLFKKSNEYKGDFLNLPDYILKIPQNFELLELNYFSDVLHKEKISLNLFYVLLTFIIYELRKFEIFDRLNDIEKKIAKRYVSWNPRVEKIFEDVVIEENNKEVKKEIDKFLKDKFSEISALINTTEIKALPYELSKELSKILRFVSVTIQEEKRRYNFEAKKIFQDTHIFYPLKYFKLFEKLNLTFEDLKKDLKEIFAEGYKIFKGEKDEFFNYFLEKKAFGYDIKLDELYGKMLYLFKDIFQNVFDYKFLEKKIILKPLEKIFDNEKKENHFIYFSLIPKGAFFKIKEMKRVKIKSEEKREVYDFIRKNKETITVLVYDIRGSTFMSFSLFNANKELSIKKKFQEMMKRIILKYGGFPVKETGDGGIAFFAENSKDLYNEVFEETIFYGNKVRFQKAMSQYKKIKPSKSSASKAVSCAIEMLEGSEEFIRRNYPEYRGFFPDVVGIDSPLKSLFRLGIGIFSGVEGKDLYLSFNAFGDFDIQGPALNLAEILSEVKYPDSSTFLMDLNTFANLILNSDLLEVVEDIREFDIKDLFLLPKNFKFKDKEIIIKNLGFLDLEESEKFRVFKREKIKEIEFKGDFIFINGKRGIPVYGGKR